VLVVDDERLARQRMLRLLEDASDVDIAGTAATGDEAIDQIRAAHADGSPIDIVFLDVQMPGRTGLDVVREVGPEAMPVTIFVTAYDQHALAAFELAAVDYVLKPFDNERFEQTLERARRIVRLEKVDALQDRLLDLLRDRNASTDEPSAPDTSSPPKYMERIAVDMRGQIRVVPVDRIDYFAAKGNYVQVHAGDDTYLINDTMRHLEERLDPNAFARIHRSTIVQLDRVETFLTSPGGDYALRLRGGTRLKVARGRRDDLMARLGLDA
jgi:two-component system LytT family response regulator